MITQELVNKVREVVDAGLCRGVGTPEPGKMCVEAAVCFAMGLPHSDDPPCVGSAVRAFKIGLNDANWSSDSARAAGLRDIAVAQLGSVDIDQQKFARLVVLWVINQILADLLERIGLEVYAKLCRDANDLKKARSAASAAYLASSVASASYAASSVASASYTASAAAADAASSAFHAALHAAFHDASSIGGNGDDILRQAADIGVRALQECGSPGCAFLES